MSEGSVPVICVLGLRHEPPGCVRSKRAAKNRVPFCAELACAYFRFDDETQTLAAKHRYCQAFLEDARGDRLVLQDMAARRLAASGATAAWSEENVRSTPASKNDPALASSSADNPMQEGLGKALEELKIPNAVQPSGLAIPKSYYSLSTKTFAAPLRRPQEHPVSGQEIAP